MTTYDFVAANKRKSAILIALFVLLVAGLGWALDYAYDAGGGIFIVAVVYSMVSAVASYYGGDKVALAVSGARPADTEADKYVVRMVENLCIATGTPMPKVYVIQDDAINAFATGRDPEHASIAVTTGAVRKLENEELEGVLAHELSHVRNYDIRVMTIVIVLVGIVAVVSDLGFRMAFHGRGDRDHKGNNGALLLVALAFAILAPIAAQLIKLAVSRKREFLADASGALMTRYPEGLARALEKIGAEARPMARASASTAHLFIANPFTGKALAGLFSTHPPVEQRVAALRAMGGMH